LDDFKSLVKKAHEMGFKVIIDWVANHTGWDHVWTKTHPEYFEKDTATNDFKIASGMDDIIELDFKNPALRRAMIDAMKYWVTECDIDGYRCDLAFWVELDFWMEARTELEKTKTLFWLAENDGIDNPSYYQAFDACYTWTWMHKTEDFYKQHQDKKMLDSLLYRMKVLAINLRLNYGLPPTMMKIVGTEPSMRNTAMRRLSLLSIILPGRGFRLSTAVRNYQTGNA
jgi:glycosidase